MPVSFYSSSPSTMTQSLPIQPFTAPVRGVARVPGSKSITNRALALAALCHEVVTLRGALFSRDTRIMIAALRALGLQVDADEAAQTIRVTGQGGEFPAAEAVIDVGNAGTAARFLTAILCLRKGGRYTLDGDAAMRARPMQGLTDALGRLGAAFEFHDRAGHFPFTVYTQGIRDGAASVDASASSQLLSALLIAAGGSGGQCEILLEGETVSHPFIGMTVAMLEAFGVAVRQPGGGAFIFDGGTRPTLPQGTYMIEPDATAASYFLALPAVAGGECTVADLSRRVLQGDMHFADVLAEAGVDLDETTQGMRAITGGRPRGVSCDFTAISDTFLTLAAISPLLEGPTHICGIGHTRHQETDRVAAMCRELRKLGQYVNEEEASLTVQPDLPGLIRLARQARASGTLLEVDTYEDHRIAMSFGILGCYDLLRDGQPWLAIRDPGCCGKTFPGFFDELARLRAASLNDQ